MTQDANQNRFNRYSYMLSKDGSEISEAFSKSSVKVRRKKFDLGNSADVELLLCAFLDVESGVQLLQYAANFGLPDRGPIKKQVHELLGQKNSVRSFPWVHSVPVDYYLNWSSLLRWLTVLIDAIQQVKHALLKTWIADEYIAPNADASIQVSDIPIDAVRLKMKLLPSDPHFNGYQVAQNFVQPSFFMNVFPSNWEKIPEKQLVDFAKAYVSICINGLIRMLKICPITTNAGTASWSIFEPVEAMTMCIFNQFTGASTIGICKNPNCRKRFFVRRHTDGRKSRRDQQYCPDSKSRCQKYCYEHPELGLGPVRKKKRVKCN